MKKIDGEAFKEDRESTSLFSPWEDCVLDAVRRVLDPWWCGDQDCLELTGIQMSPTSLVRMVMDGTLAITFGAPELGPTWMFHLDANLLGLVIQLDAGHRLGRNETEDLLVKLFVLHAGSP